MILNEKIVIFFLTALTFIIWIVSNFVYIVNKKKGIVSLILSLIFTFFTGYYIYLILHLKPIFQTKYYEGISQAKDKTIEEISGNEIFLIFKINGNDVRIGNGDEIEINKKATFIIENVEGIDKKNLKVNLIGFVGNPKFNDGQDLEYEIKYKKIMKEKAVEDNKFEVEIKKQGKKIGSVYIKFVD